ncbi:MAG TPA: selenocysteine-specific translation elongation factor [Streptosporangiaceae bacterium]|nr:selenocysteine-specific translation elongation factor [Streptosporangiaceae bacterium]
MSATQVKAMHVVVTAGHVDHGKSALIRALTGMEPDRWAEEQRRGMTIDLGFGWLTLPTGDQLAFVDVPGHERFVTNMLAGAGPVPAVMFVVAADEGWMPQSAEHLAVVSALGIQRGLLVVTKSDLADPAPAIAQATAQIAQTALGELSAVAVSAVTGAGLPELVTALDDLCRSLPEPDPGAPVRIWVDRTFSMTGSGTVVTGTLPAGTVHRSDELVITPSMRPVRVRDLQSLGETAQAASGVARVALNLRGIARESVHRGMALVQAGRWTLTDLIDVRLAAQPGEQTQASMPAPPSRPGELARAVTVHIGSARVVARVRPLGPGLARLSLAEPLPLHVGDRILLRDPGSRRDGSFPAVAGAVVLDVAPPPLARRGAAAAASRLLSGWPDEPGADELLARHGIMRASTMLAMGVSQHPETVAGEWLTDPEHWRALGHQLGEVLAKHAAAEPLAAGMPIDAARAALDLPDRRLVLALAKPPFRVACGALHIARPDGQEAGADLPEAVQAAVRVLRADLAAAPFLSPDAERLRKLGLDTRRLAAAVRAGQLMRISDQVVLAPGADALAGEVLARLPQPFTAAQAREALGTTRRTAIPLLEYLDSAGITKRLPDDRRVMPGTSAVPAQAGAGGTAATGKAAASEAVAGATPDGGPAARTAAASSGR